MFSNGLKKSVKGMGCRNMAKKNPNSDELFKLFMAGVGKPQEMMDLVQSAKELFKFYKALTDAGFNEGQAMFLLGNILRPRG